MEKKHYKLAFCDTGSPKVGQSAYIQLQMSDGTVRFVQTSPVVRYFVAGGGVWIETARSIYES